MSNPIQNRYDFVLLFDVKDGNPNGDPDAGNLPRVDPETGHGLVTDVCLKRKVRNFVQLLKERSAGYDIFVREKAILNKQIREAYEALGINLAEPPADKKNDGEKRKTKGEAQGTEVDKGRSYMCKNYFDVRTFGAVMSTGPNAGQVRGPIQMTFARSIDPIVSLEHTLTVCAARMEEKTIEEQIGIQARKYTVCGLYRCHGFVSAPLAAQTKFDDEDLKLFWQALVNMFEHDHSAARGQMASRKLIVFQHDSQLGNAPAHKLFDMVKVSAKNNPARDFSDYEVKTPSQSEMPQGVKVIEML